MKFPVLLANIQAVMEHYGWDQEDLAERVGVTQGTVSRWGNTSEPRGVALAKLSELAGVGPAEFAEARIAKIRKGRKRPTLPSGPKLEAAMAALLDSVGLSHLADEFAAPLARRLPDLLVEMQSPVAVRERDGEPLPAERAQAPAKPRLGKR